VLALRHYRDLKGDDIASLLGIPAGTVMSRLHNARRRLRTLLDESDPQGNQR
jgi:RNA polymerase sigma-70 factor (ECF subfamily)